MPVNLAAPVAADLLPINGVDLGWAEAGIRKSGRKDLLVIRLCEDAHVAGVFTQNRFCAAPVVVCREHLSAARSIKALVINTGCANAGTGPSGLANARATCAALANLIGCDANQVLPFSTGVIMEPLPLATLVAGLPMALERARPDAWLQAAETIMTTDTLAKAASVRIELAGHGVSFSGVAKGAGMIRPMMATMLGFVATDLSIAPLLLQRLVREAADQSFNRITVDGDTSTNDAFIVIASGRSSAPPMVDANDPRWNEVSAALTALAQRLAQAIVRDGEGATKFITIKVQQARSVDEAALIAYAVAHSPLVKTAFFASDPNLGRILAAAGRAGVTDLDADRVQLWLENVKVVTDGGRDPSYQEADGQRVMKAAEITVQLALGRGMASTTLWTCDLSHDYVSINADYRS